MLALLSDSKGSVMTQSLLTASSALILRLDNYTNQCVLDLLSMNTLLAAIDILFLLVNKFAVTGTAVRYTYEIPYHNAPVLSAGVAHTCAHCQFSFYVLKVRWY